MAKNKDKSKKKGNTQAQSADRHILYERAVQCVESEVDFIESTFRKLRGRRAHILREDFCGTTNTSCEWVRRHDDNVACCIDIDPEVLRWGKLNHISKLTRDQARRITVMNTDVMEVHAKSADVVLAMNFSYWVFKTRKAMKKYFRRVRKGLKRDGILFLDAFGGYEAFENMEESTEYDDFTYIWDQAEYNPITGDATLHIHFSFPDGSRIDRAFTYHWRQWTLPELTEILTEAGFRPTVYWEGEDEEGEGNGIFTPTTAGDADAGWVAYIVAEK